MRRDLVEAARRGDHEAFEALAKSGAVVVVLSNRVVEDIGAMARPLVNAVRSR